MPAGKGRPPQIDERIQYIWRQLIDPCDAPLTVWAECLWPAARDLFLAWFTPDMKQILIAMLRPRKAFRNSRSISHLSRMLKGKRGPWAKFWGRIIDFDTSNEIGKALDFTDLLRGRNVSNGVAFLWVVEGVIERIMFWWMVVDLLSEFAYDWLSLVAQSKFCQESEAAVLLAHHDELGTFSNGIWVGTTFDVTDKARNLSFWNGSGVAQTVGYGVASLQASAHPQFPGTNPVFHLRMTIVRATGAVDVVEESIPVPDGTTVELGISARVQPGDGVVPADMSTGGFVMMDRVTLYLHATPNGPQ